MHRFLPLWLVVFGLFLSLGCNDRVDTAQVGTVRSRGKVVVITLTDAPTTTEEGQPFNLTATVDTEPNGPVTFAYDCPVDAKDFDQCKGQFTGMKPVSWVMGRSGWSASFPVKGDLPLGEHRIVAFTEFGPSPEVLHLVVPKGGGTPCCTEVRNLALKDVTGTPSVFGTPVVVYVSFDAAQRAQDYAGASFDARINGKPAGTAKPKETPFASGSYGATFAFPNLPVGLYSISVTLTITLGGKTDTWTETLKDPHVVTIFPTATTVTPTGGTTTVGQSVLFTASLSGGIPTDGKVEFFDGPNPTPFATTSVAAGQTSATGATDKLPVGGHDIIGRYTSSAPTNVQSSEGTAKHTVDKAATQTTLVSGTNPAGVDAPVQFTATVASTAGAPGGSVTIDFGDGSPKEAIPLSNGSAVTTHAFKDAKSYAVTADYPGDSKFKPSNAAQLTGKNPLQVVNKSGSSLALAGPTTAAYGDNLTFTATASSPGVPAPTGNIKFSWVDGSGPHVFATQLLVTSSPGVASASASIASLAGQGAPYTITAEYVGDGLHEPAAASSALTIGPKATTLTVATNRPNPTGAAYGEPVLFTTTVARATPGGATAPAGTVSFYDGSIGGAPLGGGAVTLSAGGTATLTLATLSVSAGHNIIGVFTPTIGQPALNWAPSNNAAAPLVQKVTKAVTQTLAITSTTPAGSGAPVTFTANVNALAPGAEPAGGATIATGATVTFKDGATVLGTGTPATGASWTFTTSTLAVGPHSITAEYGGNASFAASTSNVVAQSVDAGASTITMSASKAPSIFGESVTFTAAITKPGVPTPVGSVTFKDGARTLGTVALTGGSASVAVADLAAGIRAIQAVYETATATLAHTVLVAPTSTKLESTLNPSALGQTVTLTATVTSSGAIPTGSVIFKDNGVALATVVVDATGKATTALTPSTGGTHALVAEYSGDTSFQASNGLLDQVVNRAKSRLVLAANTNPSRPAVNVTFTAVLSALAPASAIPTGSVVLKDGAIILGTGVIGPTGSAAFTTSALAEGVHTIEASFAETAEFEAAAATLPHTVSATATDIAVSSAPNPSAFGVPVTITATLGGATSTPTGTVTFKVGTVILGTGTVDATGKAAITTTTLSFGSTTITADYSGDASASAGSANTRHEVQRGTTTIALVSSANPSTVGASVSFTATVLAGGAAVVGDVEILDGTVSLGTIPVSGGSATLSTSTLAVGAHPITATYLGSTQLEGSTTIVLTQSILAAATPAPDAGTPPGSRPPPPPAVGNTPPVTTPPLAITPNASAGGDDCAMTSGPIHGGLSGLAVMAMAILLAVRRRRTH